MLRIQLTRKFPLEFAAFDSVGDTHATRRYQPEWFPAPCAQGNCKTMDVDETVHVGDRKLKKAAATVLTKTSTSDLASPSLRLAAFVIVWFSNASFCAFV